MSYERIQRLIDQANLAHQTGQADQEIELRLKAFVLSEANPPRLFNEIEKAAHLICDISDELEDPSSEEQWRQATRHASSRHGILEGAIVELVRAEEPERAFGITQRIKSPSLVRRLRAHTRARGNLSSIAIQYRDVLDQTDAIQHQLRQARRDKQSEEHLQELIKQSQEARGRLRLIETRLREEDPEALAGFAAPIEPDDLLPLFPPDGSGCLVDLYLASKEGIGLIAFRNGLHVEMKGMVAIALDRNLFLEETVKWFDALYSGRSDRIAASLSSLVKFLHDRLMCSLGTFLLQHRHWQVTIIPHLMTHALPLHLAPICETAGQKQFFELIAVSYAPCVQLALATVLRPRPVEFIRGGLPAFLLADPKEDLPAARLEQEKVREQLVHHPWSAAPVPQYSIVGRSANFTAVRKLPGAGIIYMATHARFKGGDPYGSGMCLASSDDQAKLWTIDEIYSSLHLEKSPVVVLSACESGMSYFDESTEIVALPPAFVCIGAAAVLSSLWPVEDVSTSFLVERFTYHLLDPGETPATALGVACQDIKQISREKAIDRCDDILSDMEKRRAHLGTGGDAYTRLVKLRQDIASGPERPFESPLYWGGFFITGCGWRSGGGKIVKVKTPETLVAMAEGVAKVQGAGKLFHELKYAEAIALLQEAIPALDGLWLGRGLLLLGDCLYRQAQTGEFFDVELAERQAREALKTLNMAHDILQAQDDTELTNYCMTLIKTIEDELKS